MYFSPSLFMCIYTSAPPGQLRGISVPHHWRVRRPLIFSQPLSSFPRTSLFSTSPFTTTQFSPFPLIQRRSYASIVQLEDRANSETDNPQAQSRYLAVRMTNIWHSCMFYHCIKELIYLTKCSSLCMPGFHLNISLVLCNYMRATLCNKWENAIIWARDTE